MDEYKTYNPKTHFIVRRTKGRRKPLTKEQMEQILTFRKEKRGYNWIAQKLGINNRRVIDFCKQHETSASKETETYCDDDEPLITAWDLEHPNATKNNGYIQSEEEKEFFRQKKLKRAAEKNCSPKLPS